MTRRRLSGGTIGVLLLVFFLGFFLPPAVKAAQDETAELLDSAESLFKAMKRRTIPRSGWG